MQEFNNKPIDSINW